MTGLKKGLRWGGIALLAAAMLGLGACGEKAQKAGTAKKSDAKAYQGSGDPAFTAKGWKAGDEASWEQQMRARNQNQNEYTRTR